MILAITKKCVVFGLVAGFAIACVEQCSPAHARDLTIRFAPATVSGIQAPPVPRSYYVGRPTVNLRPSAGIIEAADEAPANGCARPAFEVVSGPQGGRGCFGRP
jgi:hypothetical protein